MLSPATQNYDRGIKFKLYRSIPSLKNYILVSGSEYLAEIYTREENDNWLLTTAKGKDESINIKAINCNLKLSDVYAQTGEL